ncbi:MAG: hypothetical protein K8H89_11450 [Flavobacteriales bacterium]|jgi:hypothetical protein|nr:hypothetical protein [Flavobacteriales bacterium]MCB0759690.1 hypothetical protein [Flavobacteriales bacterium]
MKNTFIALFLLLLIASPGCKKEDAPPPIELGHAYFPTDTGRWIDYDVDTVWRNDITGVTDSLRYHLREKITEDFTDPEGRAAQRLIRYMEDSTTGNWVPKDVWWQVRTTTQVERAEENQRRIKLIFPPRTGQYWNTNALNTEDAYELTYEEVDVPWSINGMSFDSTLLVKTTYPNNAVITNTYYERYAKHVGLVYRQVDSTDTQTTGVRGTWYKQVITGYGQ